MIEFLPRIRAHLATLEDRLVSFHRHGVQLEGWFKGELLTLFDRGVRDGWLQSVDREVRLAGRKRIDLVLSAADRTYRVELKHWLIGLQKGTRWGPASYLGDKSSIGIVPDVDKLLGLPRSAARRESDWILVLTTANPGSEAWTEGVRRFNMKFAPRQVRPASDPAHDPSSFFLGLLEVGGTRAE